MSAPLIRTASLGFPRIGPRRELKTALEACWRGESATDGLLDTARSLRAATWARQHAAGITCLPSGDFSLYDHVLDTAVMVGAVPPVYAGPGRDHAGGRVGLDTYFAMARGTPDGLPAMEMTKWFDTNYHYLVPELRPDQSFFLGDTRVVDAYIEARGLGFRTRPVLLGPVSFLMLAKCAGETFDRLRLLPGLLPVYTHVLRLLAAAGATELQLDEPVLVLDENPAVAAAVATATEAFATAATGLGIMLTTYHGGVDHLADTLCRLPVEGLHLDLVRAPDQLGPILPKLAPETRLSLGVIDGRNVWRADLSRLLDRLTPIVDARGPEGIQLAPSCTLLHVPIDLDRETRLDPELRSWLAFAVQKLDELRILARALSDGRDAVAEDLAEAEAAMATRCASDRIHDPAVAARLAAVTPAMARRQTAYPVRARAQHDRLGLPAFPTTTIGSFPQTPEIRKARADHAAGRLDDADYDALIAARTTEAIRWQEETGLDVLVHGEFERNDMVQYFGEQLAGFAFTDHGWVQSYGSRYVRPPIIWGDVSRPQPMTLRWSAFARSLTDRPMKGMLTGPVTMLQWSFVRDDLPRMEVCRQIALALRDEVSDLEAAGIEVIQIDEPAFREGLPLRGADRPAWLDAATECFRLAASGVGDATQIHTHMCYSEFNDIIGAIAALDADVISIETARSKMELLDAFTTFAYPNEIGPGVYDIHSPRLPSEEEMVVLLERARARLPAERIWVNPDCGLKTRRWDEVKPALQALVRAAREMRRRVA
ncbi:5-methyltetrahydropteroyltriglutamate--homocysteine S-methyltransferase [Tistrella mobilis]